MKTLIRAVYSVVAILIVALTTCLPVHAQKRIEDRFANVNGVRLHYLIAGKGRPGNPVARLRAEQSHVATANSSTCENSYGDCTRSSRIRSVI